jgi:hypothetical protein
MMENFLKKNIQAFFFTEDDYNDKGTKFIFNLKKYRFEIRRLIKDENLAKRIKEP